MEQLQAVVDAVTTQCPWTRTKTPEDLLEFTRSELDEIAEELEPVGVDAARLEDELGDLMFDCLLLTAVCQKEGHRVTAGGAAARAAQKVIRRCPHVFAPDSADCTGGTLTAGDARDLWRRVKLEEKRLSALGLPPPQPLIQRGGTARHGLPQTINNSNTSNHIPTPQWPPPGAEVFAVVGDSGPILRPEHPSLMVDHVRRMLIGAAAASSVAGCSTVEAGMGTGADISPSQQQHASGFNLITDLTL
jgi:NTP pyrophosphatase (non-canonical NTP hydrolase)